MVDLPTRQDFEIELARRVAREFAGSRRELYRVLAENPDNADDLLAAIERVIRESSPRLNGAVTVVLQQAFVEATDAMAAAIGYTFDNTLVNQAAADWARAYAFDLERGISNTTRTRLRDIVADFFERGVNVGDTRDAIARVYSPSRAEIIAQTEITRAATEGELQGARELERQGVRLRPIHKTNRDDLVCPICGPRDRTEITDGNYPPLHPGCRCWVDHEVVDIEG